MSVAVAGEPPNLLVPADCNIQDFCRLCLAKLDLKIDLFGARAYLPSLTCELKETNCIVANGDDGLPRFICTNCMDIILKYAEFRKTSKQSETLLLNWISRKRSEELKSNNVSLEINLTKEDDSFDWEDEWNEDEHSEADTNKDEKVTDSQSKGEKTEVQKKMLLCRDCGAVLNSHSALAYHRLVHSGLRRHACAHCPKRFALRASLVKHIRVHTGDRPFTCDKCGKSFTQQSNLKSHMTSHTGEKVFCCDICGKVFTLGHNLKEHLKTHNGSRERPFSCESCGKAFYHRSHLRNHLRAHSNDRPFACPTCGKAFIKRSYLKQHNRVHTGERPYVCSVCGKAFSNSSNFLAHVRNHSGTSKKSQTAAK